MNIFCSIGQDNSLTNVFHSFTVSNNQAYSNDEFNIGLLTQMSNSGLQGPLVYLPAKGEGRSCILFQVWIPLALMFAFLLQFVCAISLE